jgi:hypothetical protein
MSRAASLLLLALATTSCTSLDGEGVFPVPGPDPKYPRLRYLDGQVSLNESCMIRLENPLSPRMPPAYVNGRPVGFC